VVCRSVVRNGPAARSSRPPLPGDMLVKVDGYDVQGVALSELRPWLAGEEGTVVTLTFEGANVRYDTCAIRAVTAGPVSKNAPSRSLSPQVVVTEGASRDRGGSWRQATWHKQANGERQQSGNSQHRDEVYDSEYDTYAGSQQHRYTPSCSQSLDGSLRTTSSVEGVTGAVSRRAPPTSWAAEADKILAEAQAKIEDALNRERLLQETLDMLREKNAVSPAPPYSPETITKSIRSSS
jgi:hypothetical protein